MPSSSTQVVELKRNETINELVDLPDIDDIALNFHRVVRSRRLLQFSPHQLGVLLSLDTLNAQEIDVFFGAVRWAQHQLAVCNHKASSTEATSQAIRELLLEHGILRLIRFPVMPLATLAKDVRQSGVLTPEELVEVFTYINSPVGVPRRTQFNAQRRTGTLRLYVTKHREMKEEQQTRLWWTRAWHKCAEPGLVIPVVLGEVFVMLLATLAATEVISMQSPWWVWCLLLVPFWCGVGYMGVVAVGSGLLYRSHLAERAGLPLPSLPLCLKSTHKESESPLLELLRMSQPEDKPAYMFYLAHIVLCALAIVLATLRFAAGVSAISLDWLFIPFYCVAGLWVFAPCVRCMGSVSDRVPVCGCVWLLIIAPALTTLICVHVRVTTDLYMPMWAVLIPWFIGVIPAVIGWGALLMTTLEDIDQGSYAGLKYFVIYTSGTISYIAVLVLLVLWDEGVLGINHVHILPMLGCTFCALTYWMKYYADWTLLRLAQVDAERTLDPLPSPYPDGNGDIEMAAFV